LFAEQAFARLVRSGASAALRVLAALVGTLPWRALRWPGAGLGWFVGSLLRVRRAHVDEAMRAASIVDVRGEARAMYRSLGTSAMELLYMARRGGEATAHAAFDPASEARWRAALGRGRGVVLAASHTGNWDLAACRLARDVELLVVTKRLSVRALDAFWQSTRAARGVTLADARGALARARAVLGRNGAVAMMIDQVPSQARHAIEAEFLGRRALVDRAPAALAAACRVPLVVAASRREADGRHVLVVLGVIEPPARPSRRWVQEATVTATDRLAEFVRARPGQWLWLHRRWRAIDPGREPRRALVDESRRGPAVAYFEDTT
jgi:KDO2-lipid IV(A) lauroyltransferase